MGLRKQVAPKSWKRHFDRKSRPKSARLHEARERERKRKKREKALRKEQGRNQV